MTTPSESEMRGAQRSDIPGAIGVPIGVLAVLLACIPILGVQISWLPGAIATTLGAVGVRKNRDGRGRKALSGVALGLGLGSLAISGGWLVVWLLLQVMIEF